MGRLMRAILFGLVGAGIVHIAVVLLIPHFSDRNAWSRISAYGGDWTFHRILRNGQKGHLPLAMDPLIEASACRFDISDLPAHVTGVGTLPYWSISVYDRKGENIYSINDRTAIADQLDLVVATPLQAIELRKSQPVSAENSVVIEADMDEGFVVVRSFVPDESWKGQVDAFLDSARCTPLL
ncbi:DUF1254 domain-containing protein [Phyllobacterium sp. 21LDTY02-6]|jgi:uncharacterized membrane protein|uniref:DUF1254 domain-containing protein n=1 Tax=unclassified Phyllobacterium TaxID=2638441 RepID=UPI00202170FB|nr:MULTISPECIES: DUF1254 domain-containing protein [unclassified Phyllobacterium]MCO4318358.1 DUF1254 domain-containing protein [Phyllobacterium sp. 21LDTY02-6]MCX8281279.1 DUF1254 domain-containing protein [Phyllobacterium sp. 0TCS1.6C]MCX8296065.1 DUF1254 domain-containing protein [Phyllobacterium sp. 0TCS1.6A]